MCLPLTPDTVQIPKQKGLLPLQSIRCLLKLLNSPDSILVTCQITRNPVNTGTEFETDYRFNLSKLYFEHRE